MLEIMYDILGVVNVILAFYSGIKCLRGVKELDDDVEEKGEYKILKSCINICLITGISLAVQMIIGYVINYSAGVIINCASSFCMIMTAKKILEYFNFLKEEENKK